MNEKIICFTLGLSEEDIEKGKASFYERINEAPAMDVFSVTKSMLDSKVGDVLASVIANADQQQNPEDRLLPDNDQYRVVIVLTPEREQVLQIMRSFKAVLPDPQNIIFAVITETALSWTFGDYIAHLGEEHEYMKNRKPQ